MKVEVRATGLKGMRERKGLTQRKLAHDLGISQNYIPAIEATVSTSLYEASSHTTWELGLGRHPVTNTNCIVLAACRSSDGSRGYLEFTMPAGSDSTLDSVPPIAHFGPPVLVPPAGFEPAT